MSVLNKKPFIKTLLESMTTEDIGTLSVLMDGGGDRTSLLKTLNPNPVGNRSHITDTDLGVHMCSLEVNFSQYNGYLIYNSDFCILLQFTDFQRIQMFNINPAKNSYELVDEYLDINELRSELDDTNQAEKAEIIDVVNKAIEDGEIEAGGLPEATKAGQVLVSNNDLEFEERDAVPQAENLTGAPEINDAMYSAGPTGGLADISTGEEAYLQEIKGYMVNWGWRRQLQSNQQVTLNQEHTYLRLGTNGYNTSYANVIRNTSRMSMHASILYDLTLMFGAEANVPFSLDEYVEYRKNGTIPEQIYRPEFGFARFFSNVNVRGTSDSRINVFKNVQATKLVESGQNLWNENDVDMVENGLKLLPGYRYEIYLGGSNSPGYFISAKKEVQNSGWNTVSLTRYNNANGQYVYVFYPSEVTYIKSYNNTSLIKFVGFVHSGNYCLTTGTLNDGSNAKTDMPIPAYEKHEFDVNVSGLNGIPDNSDNHCSVYDTVDRRKVGIIEDLSTLEWTVDNGVYSATISGIKPSTTQVYANQYEQALMSVDEDGVLSITTSSVPTGSLAFELDSSIETGQPAFEPIPLKVNGEWIVNDMGSEYFTGLDVCPVNQVSVYITNLRDKLVNLEMPSYIPAIEASTSYQASLKINNSTWTLYDGLQNLTIDGIKYRLAPLGTLTGTSYPTTESDFQSMLAIGYGSISRPNSVAIGNNANAYNLSVSVGQGAGSQSTTYTVNIGNSAYSKASYGIAIGYYSRNYINSGVSFDGENSSYRRTPHFYSTKNIFFRNADVNASYTTFAQYTKGHYLSEYINNNTMVNDGTDLTKFYPMSTWTDANNYQTFTKNVVSGTATNIDKLINGVHITVVLTDNNTTPTWHSVVGMDLMLYDSTNSLPYNSYARIDCGGTVEDIIAYIDADGCVVITAPTGTVISSVKYNIK